jgi:guanine deaminase
MDQNCPPALAITPAEATTALDTLAREFGSRLIVTDRFAVACSSRLRQAGVAIAQKHGLETQTHLAEQLGELQTIAQLYPDAPHYTAVYDRDGLLSPGCIAAHCIHLSPPEWQLLAARKTRIAHCPVSNTLLGSGTMPLDTLYQHHLDYALCTDVGASPTTSLLAEAAHFLHVHQGKSKHATATTALWRATVGARRVGKIPIGGLTVGEPFAALDLRYANPLPPPNPATTSSSPPNAEQVIRQLLSLFTPTPPSLQNPVPSPVLQSWA